MSTRHLALACGIWLLVAQASAAAQDAVFVVRHAERADSSADSPLSDAGGARAARLGAILRDAGITQIYVTERQRTGQTAAPLAAALQLTPVALPSGATDALFARLRASAPHDRVLIVGHSNTLPEILRRLGVEAPVTIGDQEYDNLFIAIPGERAAARFLQLRY